MADKAKAHPSVPRLNRSEDADGSAEASEPSESIAVHRLHIENGVLRAYDRGLDEDPKRIGPPKWEVVQEPKKSDAPPPEPTRFLNLNAAPEAALKVDAPAPAYVGAIKATIQSKHGTWNPSVLNVSQKHLVVAANGLPFSRGLECVVTLRRGRHTARFEATLSSKIDGRVPGFAFHIASLTRDELTQLVLLIDAASKPPVSRLPRWGVVVLIGLAIAGGVVGASILARPPPHPVEVLSPTRGDFPDTVRSRKSGEIVSEQRMTLRSNLPAAHVFRLSVRGGDHVRAGDLLARAEDPALERSVAAARGAVASATAALRRAKTELDGGEVDATQIAALTTAVDDARSLLRLREAELARLLFHAPFGGVVTILHVQSGDLVQPTGAVVDLVNDTALRARVPVAESDVSLLKSGMQAEVTVPGTSTPIVGRIEEIGVTVQSDAQGRFVTVDISLPPQSELRAGSSATAVVPLGVRHGVLTLPTSAVVESASEQHVVIVGASGRAEMRPVTLGAKLGARVEIRGGLKDDAVIVSAPAGITAGQRLRPRKVDASRP